MWTLFALNFGRGFVLTVLFFKFPLLFQDLGISGAEQGRIFAAVPLAALVATFGFGLLSDRLDARYVVGGGLVLLAAFLGGVAAQPAPVVLMGFFALCGLSNQAFTQGTNAYFFKGVEGGARTSGVIARFSASSSFGVAAGFLAGPPLVAGVGVVDATLIAALLALLLLPLLRGLRPALTRTRPLWHYLGLFRDPGVLLFTAMIFLFTFHWGTEATCYSPFLVHGLRLPERSLGLFMGPPIVALGLSTLVFGHLGGRGLDPRATLAASFLLSGLGAIGMVSSEGVGAAFAWRLIHEIGDGAFWLFMLGGIHRLFGRDLVGGCTGLVWFAAMLAQALCTALAAPAAAVWGYGPPQAAAGLLALVSLLGVPFLRERGVTSGESAPASTLPRPAEGD